MKTTNVSSKYCLRCNRVLPLNQFYPNKMWGDQRYHDAWCKDCVGKYCVDKESVKQYFYDNNRMWKDSIWDTALKKAQYVLATDATYINKATSSTKREEIEKRTAAKQVFSLMNLSQNYSYVDNVSELAKDPYEPVEEEKPLRYNTLWRGYYTDDQIASLEEIYSQYEEDFVLDNVNLRDYARKVAKASLNADIAEDKFRRGKLSAGEYKEAQKIFDDLSKSSNFAACRRKPGESSGMGTLGEIIMRLEISGLLNENGFTFPEDDIDKISADFRHTIRSVGIQEQT